MLTSRTMNRRTLAQRPTPTADSTAPVKHTGNYVILLNEVWPRPVQRLVVTRVDFSLHGY